MPSNRQPPVGRGPTVLLVEDNEDIREALSMFLGSEGFRVLAVADGARALSSLGQVLVDVVLTDQQLPDMLGTDVLEAAYTKFGLARGAAVIVSGMSPTRGDFAFLQKPCDLDELLRALWDRSSIGRSNRKRAQWS